MGRKSVLTDDQWIQIERRHVVEGESLNSLAAEFGINESSIRRKIKPSGANKAESPNGREKYVNPLTVIAKEKVRIDAESKRIFDQIADLPYAKQKIVNDLARKLSNISEHLGSAAEFSAASSHRLSMMANQLLDKVDDAAPMKSQEHLQAFAALQKLANSSSEIPMNLLRANKETVDELNRDKGPVREMSDAELMEIAAGG